MQWYKVKHGAHRDQKLYKVAAKLGIPAGYVGYMWVDLLDYASQQADRGSIAGFDPEGSLAMVGFPPEHGEPIMAGLRAVGMITEGRITNWDKHQSLNADPAAAERQRRRREKLKDQSVTGRDSHGQSQQVTTDLDLDRDLDKEGEKEGEGPKPATTPKQEEPKKENRAVALPSDFEVTEGMEAWAQEKVPLVDRLLETEKFKAHHEAKGSKFKDWTAAWRNWMLNSERYRKRDATAKPNAATAFDWSQVDF